MAIHPCNESLGLHHPAPSCTVLPPTMYGKNVLNVQPASQSVTNSSLSLGSSFIPNPFMQTSSNHCYSEKSLQNVNCESKNTSHGKIYVSDLSKATLMVSPSMTCPSLELESRDDSFLNSNNGDTLGSNLDSRNNNASKNESLLVPCVSVYSSNYNFSALAIAMYIMNEDEGFAQATNNAINGASLKMLAYAGAVVGQFLMGYLGDLIGRRKAMIFTLLLIFFGALCSALCVWGNVLTMLLLIGIFRFILGVGSGGVYPLSAVRAAEGTASSKAEDRSPRISFAYFFNVPGIISPYVLAAITWNLTKNVDINFRILLAFGALPILFILHSAIKMKDAEEFKKAKAIDLCKTLLNRKYWKNLLGTGVCWFLYDVAAYGILLVQPDITKKIWGEANTVNDVIWQGIVLNSIGIPGALMGILVVKQMGLKWLQFWGFLLLALSCAMMCITSHLFKEIFWLQMVMLASINFFINWGAAVTTFILPSVVFPSECRSTYNGISAAMGKLGAVVGIYSFKAVLYSTGISLMMCLAAIVSLLGAILTWFYVGQTPKTCKAALTQCFGSLLSCIPFYDCRKK